MRTTQLTFAGREIDGGGGHRPGSAGCLKKLEKTRRQMLCRAYRKDRDVDALNLA